MERNNTLPDNWVLTILQDLAAKEKYPIGDGDHGQIKPKFYTTTGIPYIRVGDIRWGNLSTENMVYIPKHIHEKNLKSQLKPGDIIIAKTGATIGKCAIIPPTMKIANTTSSVGKVSINPLITFQKWILFYFLSTSFKQDMWAVSNKTAQPGFNIENLKVFKIPLPPLNEQKRIITKIEELFSELHNSKNLLLNSQTQLQNVRKSILKTLFKQLFETCSVKPIGTVIKPRKEKCDPTKEKNTIFIGLEHIESNTGKIIGKGTSMDVKSTKSIFKNGDVLYGKLRPYLNKVCVPNFDGICSTDILVFPKNLILNSDFFAIYLQNTDFVKFTNQNMTGVQHPRINFEKISEYSIPLPSYEEQKNIVVKIKTEFSLIERIKSNINFSLEHLDILQNSILDKAFEGKLIPQDPNDEPASLLLERIKKKQNIKS